MTKTLIEKWLKKEEDARLEALEGYKGRVIHNMLKYEGGGNAELDKLTGVYEKDRREIKESYSALITNIKSCRSAKEAIGYLTQLNIGLSDLYSFANETSPKNLALPVNLDALGLRIKKERR